jgi:hypothetical protein
MDTISPGTRVRYPRTGTTGTVTRIAEEGGATFAEVDTTGLLYRIDQLIPVEGHAPSRKGSREDTLVRVAQEREFSSSTGFQESLLHTDHSCEGGG